MLVHRRWALFAGSNARDDRRQRSEVAGPLKGPIGIGGLVVALIALVCAAILLAFVFAGSADRAGTRRPGGLLLALLAFPFLLPVLIPLAIVVGVRRHRAAPKAEN